MRCPTTFLVDFTDRLFARTKDAPTGTQFQVGHVSSGFGNHATAFAYDRIFDRNDMEKFQVACFALAASDESYEWKKVESSVGTFVDLSKLNCLIVADMMNDHGIHVLVDLESYSQSGAEIFALRPALVQVTMSCATTGSNSGIDYIFGNDIPSTNGTVRTSARRSST